MRIVSCNPLELKDPDIPPVFSGYPASDRTGWEEFRVEYGTRDGRTALPVLRLLSRSAARRHCATREFIHESEWLNLYLYPERSGLRARQDAGAHMASARHVRAPAPTRPPSFPLTSPKATTRFVYLSLGSLGSADVDLMQRLVDVLSRAPHRFIVSKGPQAAELELAENMWGEEFVPQPALLPLAEVVITHAGNNTTTECFHFGTPMIALPLFWDQYDNAQRLAETGYGITSRRTSSRTASCFGAIDRLWEDESLYEQMADIAARVQGSPGTVKAADLIEQVAYDGSPVPRR